MAFRFRKLNDSVDGPLFVPLHDSGTVQSGGSIGVSRHYGSNSTTQGVNVGAALTLRSRGSNTTSQSMVSDSSGVSMAFGSNSGSVGEDDEASGGAEGVAFFFGENETAQEMFSDSSGSALSFGSNSGSINTSTPADIQAIVDAIEPLFAQAEVGIEERIAERLPAMVRSEIRSAQVLPGVSVALKEQLEFGATLGTHKDGKVLPGTPFPVAPWTPMFYTDPISGRNLVEYTIDSNGNRVIMAFFDESGTRIQVRAYPE